MATCNTTGLWSDYDSDVEEGCLKFLSIYVCIRGREGRVYQNIFCAVCNGDKPLVTDCIQWTLPSFAAVLSNRLPPLTLLLGLASPPPQGGARQSVECASHQWQTSELLAAEDSAHEIYLYTGLYVHRVICI
ncbi:hypothetical protein C0Q70_00080 [Pomacea canaliculata]|uniref:Uncharacterized protein n=1 Tax=Pomacea canaliculata TaxID=400727 RepID=A0A2T7PVQ1_POMCA|nr:hypothetical protein C0Q70_00080 [Pomacea canaliculata]